MSTISPSRGISFEAHAPVLVIGGGACGLTAALKARDTGADVVVLERDAHLTGSTAMSSGFIPATGTRAGYPSDPIVISTRYREGRHESERCAGRPLAP